MTDPRPPYQRIVADIERRVAEGELRPGDPVPTTRAIMREWGVAMATATKALTALKQAGVIESAPRVGSVVAAQAAPRRSAETLERDRIVRAAIEIADVDGLASLSMRSVGSRLGVATMSLYRHVESKGELARLMADAAFAEIDYPEPPPGWRSHLRVAARLQWAAYQRHPWLPRVVSVTRPIVLPGMVTYAQWSLRALDDLGLPADTRLLVYATLVNYVRGTAVNIESETDAERDTGLTSTQWMSRRLTVEGWLIKQVTDPRVAIDLETIFAFGLERVLDGLSTVITPRR